MSPRQGSCRTTWGTVSSGFREIEIGWNLWGLLPHLLPQQNQAADDCPDAALRCATASRATGKRDARDQGPCNAWEAVTTV
jgi:hypothetical protein